MNESLNTTITTTYNDIENIGDYNCNENIQLSKNYCGNITVNSEISIIINGMLTGNLIIKPNANVDLSGTLNGNLFINSGTLSVQGTINGNISNQSGNVSIEGVLNGNINTDIDITISDDAVIDGIINKIDAQ